jgi:hypothetical protein
MSWAMAVMGTVAAVGAAVEHGQAKEAAAIAAGDARRAQRELDEQKDLFRDLDTSNPYLNMENVYEDLTVNMQASEFERDQQMATQANIMQQMRGAAGGSGIAALAQTLANQGAIDAQKTQANIAQQEQQNMLAERQEAARIQGLEREGELISRQAQFGKISSLMGMAAGDVTAARSAEMQAIQMQQQAIQQGIQGAGMAAAGGAAGISDATGGQAFDAQFLSDYQSMSGVGGTGAGATGTGLQIGMTYVGSDGKTRQWNGTDWVIVG